MRSLLVLGTSRSGKSLLVSRLIADAQARRQPVTILDSPRIDGTSTFTDFTNLVGGAYIDIAKEDNNIFELPDLRAFSDEEQHQRFGHLKNHLLDMLMQLITGGVESNQLPVSRASLKAVITVALDEFFNDAVIKARYRAATEGGLGSPSWRQGPTLHDFHHRLTNKTYAFRDSGDQERVALNFSSLQLRRWLSDTGLARSISRVSTVRNDTLLTTYAFTNITDDEEAAVLAMVATGKALVRSLSASTSFFIADEAPILFRSDAVSKAFGRICASGLKAGIHPVLLAQDPDTILNSAAGPQILQNLGTRLIGRVQSTAVESLVRIFNYPPELIRRNASEAFFPDRDGLYSKWLLDDGGTLTPCRFYPSPVLLALTANNPPEQRARTLVMNRFPGQPVEGLVTFAHLLTTAIRSGDNLEQAAIRWQRTAVG